MKKKMNSMEDDSGISAVNSLGFFQQAQTSTVTRFFLDEDIIEPSYYRNLLQILLSASSDDYIELWINTNGGDLSSAEAIISGILTTEGKVVGVINGKAYSAGSMIALSCHEVVVLPTSTMMLHEASYGISGKGSDVRGYTDFSTKHIENILDSVYEGFLTASEIEAVKNGKEMWMLSEEIQERLGKREEFYQAKHEQECEECQDLIDAEVKKLKKKQKNDKKALKEVAEQE